MTGKEAGELFALIAEQGRQIVELSKALAIAHEHHNPRVAPLAPHPIEGAAPKLYYSEQEEDELYAEGKGFEEDTRQALQDIIAEAGIPAPITLA